MALGGCGTVELFGTYEAPESADVAAAPYPRLVDVPSAPPAGQFNADVPDPAEGTRTLEELGLAASLAEEHAARLSPGPISPEERAALLRRANAPRP